MRVPRRFGEGLLLVSGGGTQADEECFFDDCVEGDEEVTSPDSFDELLAAMAGAEHTFDLVANLNLRGAERKAVSVQPNIILGQKAIQVLVVG